MKTWLATQRFDDDAELQAGVREWLKSQAAKFYGDGINKLVDLYDKCLNLNSDCVENSLRLWLSNVYNKKCFLSLGFFLIPKRKLLSG